MIKIASATFLAAAVFSSVAHAAEIRFAPSTAMTLSPAYSQRGYYDLLAHTIAIRTGPNERLKVQNIRIDLLQGGKTVLSRTFTGADAAADTRALSQIPVEA